MEVTNVIKKIADINIFSEGQKEETFVGRPFYIDYQMAHILIADSWKFKVGGIPQGSFLLAFYENEKSVEEALLLRALEPVNLPTHNDVISSMIEYYKDNLKTAGESNKLDEFTRYEFSFSGLKCRILGTFYKDTNSNVVFGADVENYYSAHNYRVFKPVDRVLEKIANQRDGNYIPGCQSDIPIGKVRYSSSIRHQEHKAPSPVYISPTDFLGKRTALFGMTRTGKSNTVKKIIEATAFLSSKSDNDLVNELTDLSKALETINSKGFPIYPVGQMIFDVNGEYANPNMQDEGTAIYEMFIEKVVRYSVIEKPGFKVMKTNFFKDKEEGFSLIQSGLSEESSDYVRGFLSFDIAEPDPGNHSATTRYGRQIAAYLCCLYRAGFIVPNKFKVKFTGNKDLNTLAGGIDPSRGVSLEDATTWFTAIWNNQDDQFFISYRTRKGKDWVDDDLRNILIMLTRKRTPGGNATLSGYIKLQPIKNLHTDTVDKPFAFEILEALRTGRIVIVDLSQGDPNVQRLYSKRICRQIFADSMLRFINNQPNNFVQFYFEEAHNLFPKKEDKDLTQIYNRIAKEGAKLNLGLIYATQEVSSISSNILKNTQNWFIAHLNNEDELKELRKYYDFADFAAGLTRFSASSDKGFVRMKTYSNPFVVPVQIDRFTAQKENS